jgi:hypothetical protein
MAAVGPAVLPDTIAGHRTWPPKLVKLKCRPIKGDDNNILVDYAQHDEHSDKPNHSHTTRIAKYRLREMLWEMIKHVEDDSVVAAVWQVRNKAARKFMREVRRKQQTG